MPIHLMSIRFINFLSGLLLTGLLSLALYLQHAKGLEPCPLCMAQRFIFIGMAALYFLGILLPPHHRIIRNLHQGSLILLALLGVVIAGRQLWIIHFAASMGIIPSCGADFYYMLQHLPLNELFTQMMQVSMDCTKANWAFLGISLPGWSLLTFLFFIGVSTWQLFRKPLPQ